MDYMFFTDRFTSPSKTASRALEAGGLHLGTVTKVDDGIYVEIPKIAANFSFGPCLIVDNWGGGPVLEVEGSITPATISLASENIFEVGSKVLCGFLNNGLDEIIILGLLA